MGLKCFKMVQLNNMKSENEMEMKIEYYKKQSSILGQQMEFKIVGEKGPLCLILPCQDGRFFEWEDRGMFSIVENLIEEGKIRFLCADSIDWQTWSSYGDSASRMKKQEDWIQYLMKELIPQALEICGLSKDSSMMVMGASMGASHATNLYFRFPQRFHKLLAFSGIYDLSYCIHDGNFDGNFYQNNVLSYLPNMELDHPYLDLYGVNQAIFVVGQGPWEWECADNLRRLDTVMSQKGIPAKTFYWGYDIAHDWPFWKQQMSIYFPELLDA